MIEPEIDPEQPLGGGVGDHDRAVRVDRPRTGSLMLSHGMFEQRLPVLSRVDIPAKAAASTVISPAA